MEKCHSLFILASMSRGNPAVARLVVSSLSEKDRRLLLSKEGDDVRTQVLVDYLNHCLCQAAVLDIEEAPHQKMESRLSRYRRSKWEFKKLAVIRIPTVLYNLVRTMSL